MLQRRGNTGKTLALQVGFPNNSTKNTADVTGNNMDTVVNKINQAVVNDQCPEGINCMGGIVTSAFDKVKGLLATRSGQGSIGFKSVSHIKQEKLKIELDDQMEDEKDKSDSGFDALVNIKNKKSKVKIDDNSFNVGEEEAKPNNINDEQIDKLQKEIMKMIPNNSLLKLLGIASTPESSDGEKTVNNKNEDDTENPQLDDYDILNLVSQILNVDEDDEPTTRGTEYFKIHKIMAVKD